MPVLKLRFVNIDGTTFDRYMHHVPRAGDQVETCGVISRVNCVRWNLNLDVKDAKPVSFVDVTVFLGNI